ncbi:MAG TPA: phosphotransferase [Streptosporangiaceae bacterium]|nr:phosphotransferase [Streptosporangiaceae bacterium]
MATAPLSRVLDAMGMHAASIAVLKDVPMENASWLVVTADRQRLVLRRYHSAATTADLGYEHAVLRHLAGAGWVVPDQVGDLVQENGLWYCLTRYVPGKALARENAAQRRRRGVDMARLNLALRGLSDQLGQRPGWRAQQARVTVHDQVDWAECIRGLMTVSPRLASWSCAAAADTRASLAAIGASELPLTVVHGDFASWNVHYQRGRLAGVIDFGLTHLDSRPYELAVARTYRAPEAIESYRAELARSGWPLTGLEEAAIGPMYRAFRVDMIAWHLHSRLATGDYDLQMIRRQLARTGTPAP